jgi:hypothetical protein
LGAFLRGAAALELAAAFPVLGWFIVIPLAIIASLGATAFAVLHWMPANRLAGSDAPPERPVAVVEGLGS